MRAVLSRLAAATALGMLAACAQTMSPPPPAMPAQASIGTVLTDSKGMTLYVFDKDAAGKSSCNGPCANNWPPLMVAANQAASGDWTVITRDDGSKQWAYKGRPLYGWAKDQKAGDTTGDGFLNGAWHAARP